MHADALDSEAIGLDWAEYAHYYIARLWRTMVSSYTALNITQHGDRLPAMAGLAKHMAARRKSAYRAGLWEDALLDDLLWLPGGDSSSKPPRPVPRAAPTWSWASTGYFVQYNDGIILWDLEIEESMDREPYQHFAKVEECAVVAEGVDEFGMVSQGRLRISGRVATGVLERDAVAGKGRESLVYQVVFPGGTKDEDVRGLPAGSAGRGSGAPWGRGEMPPNGLDPGAGGLWGPAVFSLVLRPVVGASAVYERIGCVRIIMPGSSVSIPLGWTLRASVWLSARQTVVIV